MPTEVVLLRNRDEDGEMRFHHDNYLVVSSKQDVYSLGRTIDWLLDQNPLRYITKATSICLRYVASYAQRQFSPNVAHASSSTR
jgi:hypothetical protein